MTTETTTPEPTTVAPKAAVKKAVKKAAPAKAPAKKVAKKAAKESTPRGETARSRTFRLLSKTPDGLTGSAIMEKLELSGIPSFLKDEGLCATPRIKRVTQEGVRGVVYQLTAAGRKAVEKGTVDSDAAPKAVGVEWPVGK